MWLGSPLGVLGCWCSVGRNLQLGRAKSWEKPLIFLDLKFSEVIFCLRIVSWDSRFITIFFTNDWVTNVFGTRNPSIEESLSAFEMSNHFLEVLELSLTPGEGGVDYVLFWNGFLRRCMCSKWQMWFLSKVKKNISSDVKSPLWCKSTFFFRSQTYTQHFSTKNRSHGCFGKRHFLRSLTPEVWHKWSDLRLLDHEPLYRAHQRSEPVSRWFNFGRTGTDFCCELGDGCG